jgi:putative OPT family oligopeptide transporter
LSVIDAAKNRVELTFRSLILGAVITLIFTFANVYLGLKIGLTFASSIPAAVISMAVLRVFKGSTIWENNIVQTVASSAGTLSSIIFVLPGLVMIGVWQDFPFWSSFSICAIGGVLGVMFSIPLRRALVTESDLPYPEGVAGAEVLKVGARGPEAAESAGEGRAGLITMVGSSIVSAGLALLTATKLVAAEVVKFVKVGAAGASSFGTSFSLALLGAGHLIGLSAGLAMLAGLIIAWGIATPFFVSQMHMAGDLATVATAAWKTKVRMMGAGAIGVAALWTLAKLLGPVTRGVASALAAQRKRTSGEGDSLPITERDIPIGIVALVSIASFAPLAWLLLSFLGSQGVSGPTALMLIGAALVYIVVAGFFVAAICGYMAGLIGSSNSPLSGVGILAVVGAALLLLIAKASMPAGSIQALTAFALFVTAVVFAIATISNDNLQDLKTGQLVGATPWKQQVALVVGVLVGAAIIPPILSLMNHAYGFTGGPVPVSGGSPLPAPQATLISTLAKSVLGGNAPWDLIGMGAALGVGIIILDELLGLTKKMRLPPLAVGIGIYLPMTTTAGVVVGAVIGWIYDRFIATGPRAETMKQLGVLLASGLIVGEGLIGVVIAGIVYASGKEFPLAVVGDSFAPTAEMLGLGLFAALVVGLYAWITGLGRNTGVKA